MQSNRRDKVKRNQALATRNFVFVTQEQQKCYENFIILFRGKHANSSPPPPVAAAHSMRPIVVCEFANI